MATLNLSTALDLSPLFDQIWHLAYIVIPIAILAAVFKSAWFKGKAGEFSVNAAAKLFLDKDEYRLFKDVTIPAKGGTTQIDHIVVSKFGVFVIETKNMKGWIFGSPRQKTWTQKIYRHSSKFQNPLHQNYKHVKTLQVVLGLSDNQVFSVVVFVGDSTFKTKMPDNVTQGKGYIRFIKSKQEVVLSEREIQSIVRKIEKTRLIPSLKTNRDHVRSLRKPKNT